MFKMLGYSNNKISVATPIHHTDTIKSMGKWSVEIFLKASSICQLSDD